MSDYRPAQSPVAIVGVSALTPGAMDVEGFWRTVMSRKDLITDVPPTHWLIEDYYDPDPSAPDKTYGKRGAFLPEVDFDPMAFGIPPNALPATDTTQLLALLVAEQVLADATGGDLTGLDRERVSVILGTAPLDLLATMGNRLQRPVWLKALREAGVAESEAQAICDRIADHYVPWQEATFPGLLSNVVAGRIANRFDLHGTNATTDAACASSLAALSTAVDELALGAPFTDPGADTHTCTVTWDDGAQDSYAAQNRNCDRRHTFTRAGMYTLDVTVTDDDGGADHATVMVVVYDPDVGVAHGNGRLDEARQTRFNFTASYPGNIAALPQAAVMFSDQQGGLRLRAHHHVEWAVITPDHKVAIKGTGELIPGRNVGFVLYGYDDCRTAKCQTSPDRLRMVIWDIAASPIPEGIPAIYDNRTGSSYDLDRTQPQAIHAGTVHITRK